MASLKSGAVLRPIGDLFETGHAASARAMRSSWSGSSPAATRGPSRRWSSGTGDRSRRSAAHVLRDPHDAEDAFQATFLILARKAGSLWVGDSLAAWLHRVARRVAVEANRQKARRRAVEKTGLELDAVRIGGTRFPGRPLAAAP